MIDHPSIPGIHHVTAIASGAQTNYNFYTDVLGLKLVKRTVNFDAPDTQILLWRFRRPSRQRDCFLGVLERKEGDQSVA